MYQQLLKAILLLCLFKSNINGRRNNVKAIFFLLFSLLLGAKGEPTAALPCPAPYLLRREVPATGKLS